MPDPTMRRLARSRTWRHRLSDEAKAGQILVSQRVAAVVGRIAETAFVRDQPLKGFARSVPTYELPALRCLPVASK
jgi:class 3 adenylate cyclase